ncbi:hypothetical protein J437_LFUL017763 [Ladona fulva]|uniref:G-protein coupled receptors family 1 profile domain-containing protein n=1 Tax=Ladona fulva TaxID=123851 RepID=A0A8K0KAV1_LADFU|nr:hypothetical protein J437_LFUL017763 [Ladona fulva]
MDDLVVNSDDFREALESNSSAMFTNEMNITENATENVIDYVPYVQRPETYIVPTLFAAIFIVGVIGNGTLVLIFLRNPNMRNIPNTYIFSLALGDLLVIITCVPFTSTVYTVDSWPYGELICKLSECAKDISIGVSVFTLTALSADRFFAIVDPMRTHTSSRRATGRTVAIAVGIWGLAILCALPAAIASYIAHFVIDKDTSFDACYPYPESWGMKYARAIVISKFFLYYAVPLTIIAFFYILMARHLVLSTRNMPGEGMLQGHHQQAKQVRARKKVARMVLAFVIIFAVCFLPQHIFMLWFYNHPTATEDYNGFWHALRIVGFCLGFINSCINPIALYLVSGAFRMHFKRYLFCCCSNKNVNRQGHRGIPGRGRSSKSTWESSQCITHYNSTLRPVDEFTLTTMNGSGTAGVIVDQKRENPCGKNASMGELCTENI